MADQPEQAGPPAQAGQPAQAVAAGRRPADFAAPYLGGAALITDLSGGLAAVPDLGLPPGSEPGRYRRASAADWAAGAAGDAADDGTVLVIPAGPDPASQLPLASCGPLLARLPAGGQALLLLGYPAAEIPVRSLAGLLTGQRCLLLEAAELDDQAPGAGLALARLADTEPPGPGTALAILNERLLTGFQLQSLQARLADLERTDPAGAGGLPEPPGYGAADRDRLARTLRSAQRDLVAAHEELAALERSATVALGRAMVTAARRPWPGAARLPREAYRLWREHGARARAAPASDAPLALAQDRGAGGLGDRWLAAYTVAGRQGPDSGPGGTGTGLVVAGILTAAACAAIEPDAVVHPLLPHNADFVLEATGADLVLIETAGLLPGSPWCYAADPAAADRGRRLAALVSLAHSLGKPVVLLRDTPRHRTVGLDWLDDRCDAVTESDLGVQLARFNPVALAAERPCGAVYAGERDPREPPALRLLLDELADGLVTVARHVSWRAAPELYRGHGLFLAATAAQAREQLACGARVIGPAGGNPPPGCCPAPDAARAAGEIKAALEAGSRGLAEIRPILREIFETHATPVRLAALAGLARLPGWTASGRQVAVLAELADPGQAGMLAADLARQRLAPSEIVVCLPGGRAGSDQQARAHRAVETALRSLTASGAVLRIVTMPGLPALAAAARSPWAAPWSVGREHSPWYLADLGCARECGRADAVGYGPGPGYGYAPVTEPSLARRELLAAGGPPPREWAARGLRTMSIAPGSEVTA